MKASNNPDLCGIGMEWTENPLVWDGLDELMTNAWPDMKNFLDALSEHKSEISPVWTAILFHGMGQMCAAYVSSRAEANEPPHAFAISLETVLRNPTFSSMMGSMMNDAVDKKVEQMRDGQ